jgi:hypothetical protein
MTGVTRPFIIPRELGRALAKATGIHRTLAVSKSNNFVTFLVRRMARLAANVQKRREIP